jgi:hypothetical protein
MTKSAARFLPRAAGLEDSDSGDGKGRLDGLASTTIVKELRAEV